MAIRIPEIFSISLHHSEASSVVMHGRKLKACLPQLLSRLGELVLKLSDATHNLKNLCVLGDFLRLEEYIRANFEVADYAHPASVPPRRCASARCHAIRQEGCG